MLHFILTEFNVKYGEDVTIPCNIRSNHQITTKWYKAGGKEITHDSNYVISKDRSTLTLKSIHIEMQGSYACEATLNTDPTVKETHNTEVKIPGLGLCTNTTSLLFKATLILNTICLLMLPLSIK